jgi:hypothetical protein
MNYLKKFNESNDVEILEKIKNKIIETLHDLKDVIIDYLDKGLVDNVYEISYGYDSDFYGYKTKTTMTYFRFYGIFDKSIEGAVESFIDRIEGKYKLSGIRININQILGKNILDEMETDISETIKNASEIIERLKSLGYDVTSTVDKVGLNLHIKIS